VTSTLPSALLAATELVAKPATALVEATAHPGRESIIVWGAYIVAAALFILSLKWLSHPKSARHGVLAGEIGMAMAVIGTLLMYNIVDTKLVLLGIVVGSAIGAPMAIWMPMTAVPQRTALSHAFGALAAALVGTAHYFEEPSIDRFTMGILAAILTVIYFGICIRRWKTMIKTRVILHRINRYEKELAASDDD
jgi:NAD/NADP transhydrogenase beta subunit